MTYVAEVATAPRFYGGAAEFWQYKGHEAVLAGGFECVAGETLIYDPVLDKERTIVELAERNESSHVSTLQGTRKAMPPFLKGYARLYRVTMVDGQSFVATARHRVLSACGWMAVSCLRPGLSLLSLPPSSLVSSRLELTQGADCSPQTVSGYQFDCFDDFRPRDEPPLWDLDSALETSPSLDGVPLRSYAGRCAGGSGLLSAHNHLRQLSCHPSNGHFSQPFDRDSRRGYCSFSGRHGRSRLLTLASLPSGLGLSRYQSIAAGQGYSRHERAYASPLSTPYGIRNSPDYTAVMNTVSSVEYERDGEYYDLHVPAAGHYLAHGVIHHNTGKTMTALYKLHALLCLHPNSQALMVRRTYKSIKSSAVVTYEKKILTVPPDHPKSPISCYGGESPEHYSYPNGSRLHVGGMDNADKFLSAEFDFIYVNQAEEIGLDDWEKLLGRATGRAGNAPYTQIMGDCNPGPPTHWIKQRESLRIFQSRHEDNPTLFDHVTGKWTEQGQRTLAILDSLTGTRYKRGRLGLWVQAEGAVYEGFDTSTHVLSWQELENLGILLPGTKTLDRKKVKRVIAGVDWGFTNPGVIQIWAVDGDGRMYLVHEVYQTKKLIGWWVDEAKKLRDEYKVELFICDPAEPSNIQEFRNAGLFALEANNDITAGIQKVATRLKIAGDGQARLYVARGALRDADPILLNAKKPTCLLDEMPAYEWPTGADGKPVKEVPLDVNNHAADACRYATAYADGMTAQVLPKPRQREVIG